jgi:hypothetical protein
LDFTQLNASTRSIGVSIAPRLRQALPKEARATYVARTSALRWETYDAAHGRSAGPRPVSSGGGVPPSSCRCASATPPTARASPPRGVGITGAAFRRNNSARIGSGAPQGLRCSSFDGGNSVSRRCRNRNSRARRRLRLDGRVQRSCHSGRQPHTYPAPAATPARENVALSVRASREQSSPGVTD